MSEDGPYRTGTLPPVPEYSVPGTDTYKQPAFSPACTTYGRRVEIQNSDTSPEALIFWKPEQCASNPTTGEFCQMGSKASWLCQKKDDK